MWFASVLGVSLVAYNTALALSRAGSVVLVPLNTAATILLVVLGLSVGLAPSELGLSPDTVGAGLRWGAVLALVVPAGLGLTLVLPGGRRLLLDARLAELSRGALVFRVLVRIPVATALFEEIAFRGVLLASLMEVGSLTFAVTVSSVAFGLWHVGPAWERSVANRPGVPAAARLPEVLATVVVTSAGGALFALLRIESGSILAPVIVHAAANIAGTVAGAWASRPR